MDVSSTTTRSAFSRLPRSWRKGAVVGPLPSSRCRVIALDPGQPRPRSASLKARALSGQLDRLLAVGRPPCRSARPSRSAGGRRAPRPARARGHEQPGDGGGLAGAGAAGDDGRPLAGRVRALGRRAAWWSPASGKTRGQARRPANAASMGRRGSTRTARRSGRRGPGSPARGSGRGRAGRAPSAARRDHDQRGVRSIARRPPRRGPATAGRGRRAGSRRRPAPGTPTRGARPGT